MNNHKRFFPVLMGIGVLALAGCGDKMTTPDPDATPGEPAVANASGFKADKAPCDYLSTDEIAQAFDAAEVNPDEVRYEDDLQVCRYEVILNSGAYSALILQINIASDSEAADGRWAARLDEALSEGIALAGYDVVQTFEAIGGVGDEAAYSGNVTDDKNLLVRVGDEYLIGLEYNRWNDGVDIGDYSETLVDLVTAVVD